MSICTVSPCARPEYAPDPRVQRLVDDHIDLWQRCDATVPAGSRYSPRDQLRRERRMDRFLETLDAELGDLPDSRQPSERKLDRIADAFSRHAAPVLDLTREHVDVLRNEFVPFASEFCRAARRFDAAIPASDIYQASRNAWTAAGLRRLHGLDMRPTPARDRLQSALPLHGQLPRRPDRRRSPQAGLQPPAAPLAQRANPRRPRPRVRARCTNWSA